MLFSLLHFRHVAEVSGSLSPPVPFFFLKIALGSKGLLCFHLNLKSFCSFSVKNAIGNLMEIALNLYVALGSIVILTVLILSVQENNISSHRVCVIFSCLQFSV